MLIGFVSRFYVNDGTYNWRGGGPREGTESANLYNNDITERGWRSPEKWTASDSEVALRAKYFSILMFCHIDNVVSAPYCRYYKLISYKENNPSSQRKLFFIFLNTAYNALYWIGFWCPNVERSSVDKTHKMWNIVSTSYSTCSRCL